MNVGTVGSRDYPDQDFVRKVVRGIAKKYHEATIISGNARGVDSWAENEAQRMGLTVRSHPPDRKASRQAYIKSCFDRNSLIVWESNVLVAFHDGQSAGTLDTIEKALKAGKPVYLYLPDHSLLQGDAVGAYVQAHRR